MVNCNGEERTTSDVNNFGHHRVTFAHIQANLWTLSAAALCILDQLEQTL